MPKNSPEYDREAALRHPIIAFRSTPELKERLQADAERNNISLSAQAKKIIEDFYTEENTK